MFSERFRDISQALTAIVYSNTTSILSEDTAWKCVFEMLSELPRRGGIAYVIGNGGSASLASHFSTELIKTLKIPSATLCDANLMTCLANDLGYEKVFSYPLEQILKPQDLLIAISSSGKSPNILQAATVAQQKQIALLTLSGFSKNNPLRTMGHLNFWVDRSDSGLIETMHFFLLHSIIDCWNVSICR